MKQVQFGKFKFIETWKFPREVSHFIEWAQCFYVGHNKGKYTHICCGKSTIGDLRIDMNPDTKPDLVARIQDLPKILGNCSQENIIIDPPWEIPYGDRREFSYLCRDLLKTGGFLFFNSPWSPWVQALELVDIYMVTQTFNSYRDLTSWWILKKLDLQSSERGCND